jgi:hypothetical protein
MSEEKSGNNTAANHSGIKRRDLWLGSTSLVAATAFASTVYPHAADAAPENRSVLPIPEPPL